jgi:tetrahydromethanopterin S-methyltransferase subunit G
MAQNSPDRSLGDLFSDLSRDITTLVRQEINLARTELGQTASKVGRDIGFLAVGGLVIYAGFLGILAAIVIILGTIGLPWWLSALIVGLIVAGVGYFLVRRGLDALKKENLAPQKTLETLKEDVEWAKEQTR